MPPRRLQQDKPLLTAQLADVTTLATLLRSVALCPHAIVTASEDGLEVVTELNRTIQAHAYLYASIFDSYSFQAPPKQAPAPKPTRRDSDNARPSKRARRSDLAAYTPSSSPDPSQEPEDDDLQRGVGRQGDDGDDDDDEPPSISFEVNLQTWLSCLNIFGGAQSVRAPFPATAAGGGGGGSGGSTRTAATLGSSSSYRDRYRAGEHGQDDGYDTPQGPSAAALGGGAAGGGGTTSMSLSYAGTGHPLTLELWQEARTVVTRCEIATYEATFLTDLTFDPQWLTGQVILPSHVLHTAFGELESSCSRLGVFIQPPSPAAAGAGGAVNGDRRAQPNHGNGGKLQLKAVGDTGESEMEFPHRPIDTRASSNAIGGGSGGTGAGVMEKFVSTPESRLWWYAFGLVGKVMGCLRSSVKTSLRIDHEGLCSLQFMMPLSAPASLASNNGAAASAVGARASSVPPLPRHHHHHQAAQAAATRDEYAFVEVLCVPLDETLI